MKHTRDAPAVTSLPQAPRDEAQARVRRYVITMVVRMGCFALMVLITPYGWYTWVFGLAAAVLPYIAVVFANAVSASAPPRVESPALELPAPSEPDPAPAAATPTVLTIHERRSEDDQ